MNFLEERILKDGVIKPGNVLKVDSFLNHRMDISLTEQIGKEFYRRFARQNVTKVLTIEASGIAVAYPVARELGVPMIYAKKTKSVNLDGELYIAQVESFDRTGKINVIVSKKFLNAGDRVLLIDDFLANGCAMQGLISIVESADAEVVGLGVAIEKGYLDGGYRLRNLGYQVESIVTIEEMDAATGKIRFKQE